MTGNFSATPLQFHAKISKHFPASQIPIKINPRKIHAVQYISPLCSISVFLLSLFSVFLSCPLDTQKFLISPCPNYNSVPSYILTNPTLLFIKYLVFAFVYSSSFKITDFKFSLIFYVGFPGGSDSKEFACNAGDTGSIPGSGRSFGEGNGYLL